MFYVVASKRWHKVGSAQALPLDEARRVGRVLLGRIAEGRDPTAERRATRERHRAEATERRKVRARVEGVTLSALVTQSIEAKANHLAGSTLREWARIVRVDLAQSEIGQRPAATIRRDELRGWLHGVGERGPFGADRLLALIRAAYKWALDEAEAGVSECASITRDPTRGLKRLKQGADLVRTRSVVSTAASERVAFAEFVSYWKALERLAHADRAFVRVILTCGTRSTETLSALWSEVDLVGAPDEGRPPTWRIPRERRKGQRDELLIPLSTLAVKILSELREAEPRAVRVFGSVRPAISRRAHKATKSDVTIHDCRRSLGTALARIGAPIEVVSIALGHRVAKGVERHYVQSTAVEVHRL